MKKVFISVPMRGRKKEDIEKSIAKMQKIALAMLSDDENYEYEFVNTEVKEVPPYNTHNEAVWYLGKAIELLSQCDILVCVDNFYEYPGCHTETNVAERYGIKVLRLCSDIVCPDLHENYETCSCPQSTRG